MRPMEILFVLISVALSSFSQIILKRGMTSPVVQTAIKEGGPMEIAVTVAQTPLVVGGLACFALSAVFWLVVLSRTPLSQAYPCVALGIVVTIVAGATLFGETISGPAMLGVAFIALGVALVGVTA